MKCFWSEDDTAAFSCVQVPSSLLWSFCTPVLLGVFLEALSIFGALGIRVMRENASPLCPSLFFCETYQTRSQFREVKTLPLLQVQQGLESGGIAPLFCTKSYTVKRALQISGCCLEKQHVTWIGASEQTMVGLREKCSMALEHVLLSPPSICRCAKMG